MLSVWHDVKVINVQDNKDAMPANIYDCLLQLWCYANENEEGFPSNEGISHIVIDKESYLKYDESEWTENEHVAHWLVSLGYDPDTVLFIIDRIG